MKVPKNSGNLYFIDRGTSLTPPFNQYKKVYDEIAEVNKMNEIVQTAKIDTIDQIDEIDQMGKT